MRLIDADALMEELGARYALLVTEYGYRDHYASGFGEAVDKAEAAPIIDAVPVVRCEKCDWYREDGGICVNPKCGQSWYGCRVPEQHFCSYGERRSDE